MDKRKIFSKKTDVIILASVLIFSSGIAIANNSNIKTSTNTISLKEKTHNILTDSYIVWDNVVGVYGSLGGIIVATVRAEGTAFPADDFKLGSQKVVDSVFWQGGYFQCQLAEGEKDYHWDWRIIFWDDCGDGTHPGNEIYNQTIPNASIIREFWYNFTHPVNGNVYWVANYSVQLPENITFNANTKYWITIQGIQGTNAYPQACWTRHNKTDGGIKLYEAVIKAAWWGLPQWTKLSQIVADKLPHDLNYQLFGPVGNNPPETPSINGPKKIKPNVEVNFTINAVDPDADDLFFFADWGDGNNTGWIGPYSSAENVIINHTWVEKGTYTINVKAKDLTCDAESEWASLTVKIPRTKTVNSLLQQILTRFSSLLPIIKNLLIT